MLELSAMFRTRAAWWTAIAILVVAARADAQIVNVQGAIAKPPEQDGVTAQIETKLDWREGNMSLIDVGATATVLVRHCRLLGLAIVRGEYGRSNDLTFKRKTFEHLRLRTTLGGWWRWEAFGQHELDTFRRLSVRALAGTGPAVQLLDRPHASVLAGAAYLLEYERLDRRMGARDAGARRFGHRASFYATGSEPLSDAVSIVQTIYVQPRLDDLGDVRALGEIAVTTKLSEHIALVDGFTVAYDRTPPDGVRRYDTQLRIALLITF
ncbi:MAG: DUF481 domain-containing protein [Kofleriaceae bacterium]